MTRDIIDVHAHCVPPALHARLVGGHTLHGVTAVQTERGAHWRFDDGFTTAPIEPLLLDLDARLERMDAAGVEVQLLSSFIDIGAHHAAGEGAAYAATFNDALAEGVASHPDRYLGLGTLPLREPDAAVRELQRVVRDLGFVGVEVPAASARDAGLGPVWAEAERLGILVLVHPEASTTSDLPYFIGNFVANPAETTAAAAALILSGVLERHPDLAVVLVHGGGFLPYQIGRIAHGAREYGARFGASNTIAPRDQLRLLHYDTVLHDIEALEHLVRTVGADRVVAGTDDPFAMADPDPAATIEALTGLDDDQRAGIRRGNAARLLARVHNDSWPRHAGDHGNG